MKKILGILVLLTAYNGNAYTQTSLKASITNGKKVYVKNCLSCHQADAGGVPKMNPPLIHASFVSGDKKKLIQWVLLGSTEKVAIDGKYYSNNMPAQAGLKDEEIADVLTYLRNNFKNKGSAITTEDVKKTRASIR